MAHKEKRIGIFSTVPVEVLFAAGLVPVDLNNLFVTHADPGMLLRQADVLGLPRNGCAWTRGLFGATVALDFRRVVAVPMGDCTNNAAMAGLLKQRGVEVIEFNYPIAGLFRDEQMELELERFRNQFEISKAEVESTFETIRPVRELLARVDEANWADGTVPGSVARACLLRSTDMGGNPRLFQRRLEKVLEEHDDGARAQGPRLALFGVPAVFDGFLERLEEMGAHVVLTETERDFAMLPPSDSLAQQYLDYAYPYGIEARVDKFNKLLEERRVDGVIIYSQAFCHHNLELAFVERKLAGTPLLVLEGDLPRPITARDGVRLEGFLELLSARRKPRPKGRLEAPGLPSGLALGMDLGSRFAKVVASADGEPASLAMDTVRFYNLFASPNKAGKPEIDVGKLLAAMGVPGSDPRDAVLVSTGYGRNLVQFGNTRAVPEIVAHAAGAAGQVADERFLLIDLGGQDTKAVVVNRGEVEAFVMNDKCAAGSGRYVENMATLLAMPLDEIVRHHEGAVELTNVCATFGESEVIGLVVEGIPFEGIAAGIMQSVAQRTAGLVAKLPEARGLPVHLAGGLAAGAALATLLSELLQAPSVTPLPEPRFNGALGCLRLAG